MFVKPCTVDDCRAHDLVEKVSNSAGQEHHCRATQCHEEKGQRNGIVCTRLWDEAHHEPHLNGENGDSEEDIEHAVDNF